MINRLTQHNHQPQQTKLTNTPNETPIVRRIGFSQTKRVQPMTKHLTIIVAFLIAVSTQANTQEMSNKHSLST